VPKRRSVLPFALGISALGLAGVGMFVIAQLRNGTPLAVTPPPPPKPQVEEPPPVAQPAQQVDDPPEVTAVPKPRPPPKPKPGVLKLKATGCAVEVRIDGKSLGYTPMVNTVTLPVGDHVLEMVQPLCDPPVKERIKISAGQTTTVERNFQKK
jgi:hypothetical protein